MLDILYTIPFLIIILWLFEKSTFIKNLGFSIHSIRFAFVIKVLAGYALFFLYTYHYQDRVNSDTFKYFDDSIHLHKALLNNPLDYFKMLFGIQCDGAHFYELYYNDMNNWHRVYESSLYNDNRLIIRINAFIRMFSFGNYHIHNLVFNLLSFIGLLALAKFFKSYVHSKWKVYVAVFLIPSVIFWSSGILKESILIFAIGLFCYSIHKLLIKVKITTMLVVLFCLCILLVLKFYVLMALFPVVFAWFLQHKALPKWYMAYGTSLLIVSLAALTIGLVNPEYNIINILVTKQNDFVNMSIVMKVNSAFEMAPLTPDFWSIVKAVPEGLINCFTKPWPNELKNPLFLASFFENLLILFALIIAVLFHKSKKDIAIKFVLFCFVFGLFLYAIIGITTPITGALVRYKVPVIPFILIGILYIIDLNKFHFPLKDQFQKLMTKAL